MKTFGEALPGEPSWELHIFTGTTVLSGGLNWELQTNVLRGKQRFGDN